MPQRTKKGQKRNTTIDDSARNLKTESSRLGSLHQDPWSTELIESFSELDQDTDGSMRDLQRKFYQQRSTTDRLLPFHPDGPAPIYTLADACRRQNALHSLRTAADPKDDKGSYYYCTTLQSEILDAPLHLCPADDHTKIETKQDPLLLHFKAPETRSENLPDYSLHPLERGPLAQTLKWNTTVMDHHRQFAKTPYKILDAPDLQDDFYYNLIHWSSKNILSVGLSKSVYLWTASTSAVEELNGDEHNSHNVTSLCWSQGASALAVGCTNGSLRLWDAETKTRIMNFQGHTSRIGSLNWNIDMLASGCREGIIRYYDYRTSNPVLVVRGHQSEVCGIQWSKDNQHLVSGGNDNRVKVWDLRRPQDTLWRITDHKAAVKALAWSPHHSKCFASGGGLKDLSIKIWNLCTFECIHNVDTGAQVCGLHWSKNIDEIVSTHGYNSNAIKVWQARTMENVATIPGHTKRIVYMTVSPDGTSIATGAGKPSSKIFCIEDPVLGDESIRFFLLFPPEMHERETEISRRNRRHDMVR